MDLLRAPLLASALAVALGAVALSGIALAVAYDPADAHASVQRIDAGPLAWARAAHAASASVALVVALLACVRAFLDGPSTRAALLGGLVVALLLAAYESGAVLPQDQRAAEAWQHVRDGAFGALPTDPPAWLAWAHGLVLPLALALLVVVLVPAPRERASWSWRVAWPLVLVALLALVARPVLGPAPVDGLAVSRPHWPFLWLVPLEIAFGPRALLALPALIGGLVLVAWRAPRWTPRARKLTLAVVLLALALLTALAL